MTKTNFVTIKLDQLEPNDGQLEGLPSNPRQITESKMALLKQNIKQYPEMLKLRSLMVYPLDNGKYIIIGGNMRYRAMSELGMKDAPCVVIPKETDIETLKAYTIIDNNGFGKYDWDMLANEWDEYKLEDWGVDLPVFEDDEEQGNSVGKAKDDDFDENNEEITIKVKLGDLWKLGEHLLLCGDSSKSQVVSKLMGGEKANCVFTDPPYGVAIGDKNKELNNMIPSNRKTKIIINDNINKDDLYIILRDAMTNVRENIADDCCVYVASPQGGELCMMMMMMMDAGLPVKHVLIWEKNCPTFSLGRLDYDYQHEPILYTWGKKHKNYRGGEFRSSIWKYDKPKASGLHPTMKPVELVANALMDGSKENDIVLDVFGGSGTTLIACEQLNRTCRMIELDPHYCDVIIARWEKLTNQKAIKIN